MRKIYLLGLLYVGLSLVYLMRAGDSGAVPDDPPFTVTINVQGGPDEGPVEPVDAVGWFRSIKAYCNPVEVDTRLTWSPAPRSADGTAYEAACFALAGRIDSARERILQLPEDQRWNAAGVVFNVGHPVADAGDDLAAGPIMELVVEFGPTGELFSNLLLCLRLSGRRYAVDHFGYTKRTGRCGRDWPHDGRLDVRLRVVQHRPTWGAKHAGQWAATLRTYAYPKIGEKRVDWITTADVMGVLLPLWQLLRAP